MARWKLTEPHYLKVPGTKWEYSEIDRTTGRPKRTQFNVPLHVDPRDPADWTERVSPEEGYVYVSYAEGAHPKDIIFEGPPTTGMAPVDKEAEEITAKFDWKPTMGLDDVSQSESYTNRLLSGLVDKLHDAQTAAANALPSSIKIEGLDSMIAAMAKMMEQNQAILNSVLHEKTSRRVG